MTMGGGDHTLRFNIIGGPTRSFTGRLHAMVEGLSGGSTESTRLARTQRSLLNALEKNQREYRVQRRLLNDSAAGTDQWVRALKGVEAASRNIDLTTRRLNEARREARALNEQAEKTPSLLRRISGAAAGIGAAAAGGAILAPALSSFRSLETRVTAYRNLQREAAGLLTQGATRQLENIAGDFGLRGRAIIQGISEINARIGLADAEVNTTRTQNLAKLGVDFDAFIANSEEGADRYVKALELVQQVTAERGQGAGLAAAGELFGLTAGRQAAALALDAEAYAAIISTLQGEVVITDENQKRLESLSASVAGARGAWVNLGDAMLVTTAGPFRSAALGLGDLLNGLAESAQESEGLTRGILGLGGVLVAGGGAFTAVSGKLGDLGEDAFFATQGLAALQKGAGLAKAASAAALAPLGALRGAFLGAAGAIRAATAASIAFAFTPVGAIIIGVAAAAAALTAGIVFLADKFGGFANLWKIAWAGIKAAALTALQVITLQLRAFTEGVDRLTAGISKIIGRDISTNLSAPFDAIAESAAEARGEVGRLAQEGLAEGRRQDEAGTSVGQRVGGFFGRGGDEGGVEQALAPPTAGAGAAFAPQAPAPTPPPRQAPGGDTYNIVVNVDRVDDIERAVDDIERQLARRTGGF